MVYEKCYKEYTYLSKDEIVRYLQFHRENANTCSFVNQVTLQESPGNLFVKQVY